MIKAMTADKKISKTKKIDIALLSSSFYVSFQIFANVLSTKIALLPVLNLAIDGGTIIYPLTFTLRDFVHKTWGKKESRHVIFIAAFLNLVMFGLFWLVGKMPSAPSWEFQEAYERILLPVGRIVVASIIAQIVSELIDTEVFSWAYKKFNDMLAVFLSNLAGLLIDSVLFGLIAFLFVLPLIVVLQIIISNIIIKFIISAVSAPATKLVPRMVKMKDM